MRYPLLTVLLLLPSAATAQAPDRAARNQTILYLLTLHDPDSGGFKPTPDGKPGLRATSAAMRSFRYIGPQPKPEVRQRAADFVMSCYDPATGGFADSPGGKPDVPLTAIGVIAAVELGVPEGKFPKAVEYLYKNAKTFEEVRIGAAALEALNKKPEWVKEWFKIQNDEIMKGPIDSAKDGGAREVGSHVAMRLRLGEPVTAPFQPRWPTPEFMLAGQRDDGGWGKKGAKGSDLEATYRVMRALYLLKEKPKDVTKLRAFVAKCRNPDGGYGVAPGEKSAVGGTYYAAIVTKWLDELEK
jgi:prenyltransferase beta subunit